MNAPTVGLAEAARICNVSESTIRRRRPELEALGAYSTPKIGWTIPIPALVEAGLLSSTSPPDEIPVSKPVRKSVAAPTASPSQILTDGVTPPHSDELDALRKELQEYRERALVAEAVLHVKDQLIASQSAQLKQLEMAPVANQGERPARVEPTPVSEPAVTRNEASNVTQEAQPVIAQPRNRWWKRR